MVRLEIKRQGTKQGDFEALRRLAKEHRPKLIIGGASACTRIFRFARFSEIIHEASAVVVMKPRREPNAGSSLHTAESYIERYDHRKYCGKDSG
ncbi:MAG: hypothetical protein KGL31_06155 [candidate division NC10 bacterium]|nr:hypothetical protein [candidate division NC10 bacterium]